MSTLLPRTNTPISSQPARDMTPRRLIVTAGVVAFALRDWSLWVLLRVGPWGPPMRLVLGNESVVDAVDRTLDAILLWASDSSLLQLKAGWQEQQVKVWGSEEQGMAVSLMHGILLRANRDELRPNLHLQPVPSLHVQWVPVAEVESGHHSMDSDVRPGVLLALQSLRAHVQHDPEIILRYLADMGQTGFTRAIVNEWWRKDKDHAEVSNNRDTQPLSVVKKPDAGDGTLTLAEASLLYRALFPADEPVDLSNLRRRFLATNRLSALDEDRPVRGRVADRRRVSRVYRYLG